MPMQCEQQPVWRQRDLYRLFREHDRHPVREVRAWMVRKRADSELHT